MPVHIKGGGGAGFPQGWKENFKGVVHEQAIEKGDPVVCGIYSDIENGMDLASMPTGTVYAYDEIIPNYDGTAFVLTHQQTVTSHRFVYLLNPATLLYEKIALPTVSVSGLTKVVAAAFSDDGKYLAVICAPTGTSVSIYLDVFKIEGLSVTAIAEGVMGSGNPTTSMEVEFMDYLGDADNYRILSCIPTTYKLWAFNKVSLTALSSANLSGSYGAGFVKLSENKFSALVSNVSAPRLNNEIYEIANDAINTTELGILYWGSSASYNLHAVSDDLQYALFNSLGNGTPFLQIIKNDGNNNWTNLANPDVIPTSILRGAAFSPGGTYLAVVFNTAPYLIIYKRTGDVFTKIANPQTMPTNECYKVGITKDGKHLFLPVGSTTGLVNGMLKYNFEAGNIVSKVTSFSANPLSWFPAGRKEFGVALDAGNIGVEIRVNLFPVLNHLGITVM